MSSDYPRLSFDCAFDDNTATDVEEKGFFDHAIVTLRDGTSYRLHFYDPARLAVDLQTDLRFGKSCIAEPGLVIVERVNIANMKAAIKQLETEQYFDHLKPIA
jgi:hypothetical protein